MIEEASGKGDYKKSNQAMKALIKSFKYFGKNKEEAGFILGELSEHENFFVQCVIASNCDSDPAGSDRQSHAKRPGIARDSARA